MYRRVFAKCHDRSSHLNISDVLYVAAALIYLVDSKYNLAAFFSCMPNIVFARSVIIYYFFCISIRMIQEFQVDFFKIKVNEF